MSIVSELKMKKYRGITHDIFSVHIFCLSKKRSCRTSFRLRSVVHLPDPSLGFSTIVFRSTQTPSILPVSLFAGFFYFSKT